MILDSCRRLHNSTTGARLLPSIAALAAPVLNPEDRTDVAGNITTLLPELETIADSSDPALAELIPELQAFASSPTGEEVDLKLLYAKLSSIAKVDKTLAALMPGIKNAFFGVQSLNEVQDTIEKNIERTAKVAEEAE